MIGRPARFWSIVPAFCMLLTASVSAQQTKPASDGLPTSTTGLAMEALWEYAPEAPDGKLTKTGPYYVSRWGGIVLRGRRDGDRVVTALTVLQCGSGKNPAMRIKLLGVPPKNICDVISVVAPGDAEFRLSRSGKGYLLFGQSTGWTAIDFAQLIGDISQSGIMPVNASKEKSWGISNFGAVFRVEGGKYVFMAPGETVKLTDRVSFEVKPVMDEDELRAIVAAAALSK